MCKSNKLWVSFLFVVMLSCVCVSPVAAKDYSFRWSANTEPVEGYRLYYKKGGEASPPFTGADAAVGASPINLGKVTSYTITGLDDNSTYHFALTAYSGSAESGYTNVITIEPVIDSITYPTGALNAVISVDKQQGVAPLTVNFDGSNSTGDISKYIWEFGDNTKAWWKFQEHVYEQPGTYTAVLTLEGADGSSKTASVEITATEEGAEQPVTPPPSSGKNYSFSWSANQETVEGYRLYYKKGGVAGPPFDGVDGLEGLSPIELGKVTNYTISGLMDNTTYHFALTAYNGSQESTFTDVITVFPTGSTTPLTAVISVDSLGGDAPLTVNFDGSISTGSVNTYSWTFGDSGVGTGSKVSHTYQKSGTYRALLEVGDGTGLVNQASVVVSVSEPVQSDPPVAAMILSATSGKAPLNVTFNGGGSTSVVPPISSYSWDFGDNSSGSGQTVNHVYNSPGVYTAGLIVEDNNGASQKVSRVITVTEAAAGDPTGALNAVISVDKQQGVAPLTVNFDGSSSTGDISKYIWEFGDNTKAWWKFQEHVYEQPGIYTAVLTLEGADGSSKTASVEITATEEGAEPPVTTPPSTTGKSYSFSWSANPDPVEGYRLYYKKGGVAGPPFDGTDGAEGVSPINLGKVTNFTISGLADNTTYHFALAAYSGIMESALTDVITVFSTGDTATQLTAAISVDRQEGDAPLMVTYDASASMGSISSYSWNFGDGDVGVGVSAGHTYRTAGVYTTTLEVVDKDGVSKQEFVEISVNDATSGNLIPPVAVIETDSSQGTAPFVAVFNGENSTSSAGTSITSYEWDFGDGTNKQYGASVRHHFYQAGIYMVSLNVTDSGGQTDKVFTAISATSPVVEENAAPFAQFTETSKVGSVPLTIGFNALSSSDPDGDNLSYSWSFGDGVVTSGAEVEHTYRYTGTFSAVLIVEDTKGAMSEAVQTITVMTDSEYKQLLKEKRARTVNTILNILLLEDKSQ